MHSLCVGKNSHLKDMFQPNQQNEPLYLGVRDVAKNEAPLVAMGFNKITEIKLIERLIVVIISFHNIIPGTDRVKTGQRPGNG